MTEPDLDDPRVSALTRIEYSVAVERMREFTARRDASTPDEIWLVEHPPVFTLGFAGRREHVLDPGPIPVVTSERGGQVTYHGPGQVVAYLLIDLRRRRMGIRDLVWAIEQAVISFLDRFHVAAVRRGGAPGVYVADSSGVAAAKIAAIGLKVSHGCTYHGVALNVAMDLSPFTRINPCGYQGLQVTDLAHEAPPSAAPGVTAQVAAGFARALIRQLRTRAPHASSDAA